MPAICPWPPRFTALMDQKRGIGNMFGKLQEVCFNFRCGPCNLVSRIIETYYGRDYLMDYWAGRAQSM